MSLIAVYILSIVFCYVFATGISAGAHPLNGFKTRADIREAKADKAAKSIATPSPTVYDPHYTRSKEIEVGIDPDLLTTCSETGCITCSDGAEVMPSTAKMLESSASTINDHRPDFVPYSANCDIVETDESVVLIWHWGSARYRQTLKGLRVHYTDRHLLTPSGEFHSLAYYRCMGVSDILDEIFSYNISYTYKDQATILVYTRDGQYIGEWPVSSVDINFALQRADARNWNGGSSKAAATYY